MILTKIWTVVAVLMTVFSVTGAVSASEGETEMKEERHQRVALGGEDAEVIEIDDLADGETRTIVKDGKTIHITRKGDTMNVEVIEEGDGEGMERRKEVIVVTDGEEGSGEEAEARVVVIKKAGEGDARTCKVICEVGSEGEGADGEEQHVKIRCIRGEGDEATETVKVIKIGGAGGKIIVDGKELDLSALENLEGLEGLEGLKILENLALSGLEDLDLDLDLDIAELCEGLGEMEEVTVYRCPEDGTTIHVPKDKDTRSKYKCPVCKTKMEKVEADSMHRCIVIKKEKEEL